MPSHHAGVLPISLDSLKEESVLPIPSLLCKVARAAIHLGAREASSHLSTSGQGEVSHCALGIGAHS